MEQESFNRLFEAVEERKAWVNAYFQADAHRVHFEQAWLQNGFYSHLAGGKTLRAALLFFFCGAVGGNERLAIPAAAAVELYHTFTLVHDDVMDRDDMRRGSPTVHIEVAQRARNELNLAPDRAGRLGEALAILTGDMQAGWVSVLLANLFHEQHLSAELALALSSELFGPVHADLVEGQTLDLVFAEMPPEGLNSQKVLSMFRKKTGALMAFAARAGAAIGLNQSVLKGDLIDVAANFAMFCGEALQIQDDVLGISADERLLGKPVGSDIREGKRTLLLIETLSRLDPVQQNFILGVLGRSGATQEEIRQVISLMHTCGAVESVRQQALNSVTAALQLLERFQPSPYRNLLHTWAYYVIERNK